MSGRQMEMSNRRLLCELICVTKKRSHTFYAFLSATADDSKYDAKNDDEDATNASDDHDRLNRHVTRHCNDNTRPQRTTTTAHRKLTKSIGHIRAKDCVLGPHYCVNCQRSYDLLELLCCSSDVLFRSFFSLEIEFLVNKSCVIAINEVSK